MASGQLREFIYSDEHDMHDRLFVLLTTVLLASWIITLAEIIIAGAALIAVLCLTGGIILLTGVLAFSLRFHRIRLGAVVISAGVCFLYAPLTFFFGGGIYGDAPLWFLFSIFFVDVSLSGKTKYTFLFLQLC